MNLLHVFSYERNDIHTVIILSPCEYSKWFICQILSKSRLKHLQYYYFLFKYTSLLKLSLTKLYKTSSKLSCKAKPVSENFRLWQLSLHKALPLCLYLSTHANRQGMQNFIFPRLYCSLYPHRHKRTETPFCLAKQRGKKYDHSQFL